MRGAGGGGYAAVMSTQTSNSTSSTTSPSPLSQLSQALADAVAAAAPFAAQVDGGRRLSASGTVVGADGLIVAASHNVERDDDVTVGLDGGRRLPAKVVGRDESNDLVLLRVEATGLAVPAWADVGGVRAGELALVVGRPGRQPRAALAMISDVRDAWRSPAGGELARYIELDAARERGFSGSLVVGAAGQPLGIATSGLLRGRGMVIPGANLQRVVEVLLTHGRMPRGFLGLAATPVRLPDAQAEALGQAVALLVLSVQPESPASQAGLLLGDVLLAIDGKSLADVSQLHAQLGGDRIGKPVTLRVLRGGEPRDLQVTVAAR